ncbi:DUF803-domain-containing protein [Rhodofomes roseus]|uniref:DUF803-domain-containing protein n=1 Tax=Rhodofomes roseus TaxID=34475 RepID=A0ABQ8KXD5_9APHY|nr:DUF803-domain-containing protein [Rhodofomes roseus]KAH9843962.1 DUF803-domain-containing protein [Rhodofomes roseus]
MPIPSIASVLYGAMFKDGDGGYEIPSLPQISRGTFAGIVVAISGNVVISLALNCQKLAHKRLEEERAAHGDELQSRGTSGQNTPTTTLGSYTPSPQPGTPAIAVVETEPLLGPPNHTRLMPPAYGSDPALETRQRRKKRAFLSRLFVFREDDEHLFQETDSAHLATTHALLPVDVVPAHANGDRCPSSRRTTSGESKTEIAGNESDYLKSKLWWFGFILMNIGELGNFISYAFAPASVVAPLGTFALIANCFFAPLMLKERFRKRDFMGILIAVMGAVTVVLSANPSDVRLGPDALVHAITQRPFVIYAAIYIAGAAILSIFSERGTGKRYVYIDVGLCALFGGFTVLSTKAFSTLLTLEAFEMFSQWITYPVLLVLISTGVGQIRYLNRALMRFDSKVVVPTQFVLFNISAIVGSAILYGDFARATFHQIVTFLYGCGATFAGVFIIAWAPSSPEEPEDDEDEEGTIGDAPPSAETDGTITGLSSTSGSVARRTRVRILGPDGSPATPILRNRQSVVSMYGLSPAQRALLLGSPPRDDASRPHSRDPEREAASTPESLRRRRTVSWLGEDGPHGLRRTPTAPIDVTRENSRVRAQSHSAAASRSVSQSPY